MSNLPSRGTEADSFGRRITSAMWALRRTEIVEADNARARRVPTSSWRVCMRRKVQLTAREAQPWRAALRRRPAKVNDSDGF